MSFVLLLYLLYFGGALLDGAKRLGTSLLRMTAWTAAVVLALWLLDGCAAGVPMTLDQGLVLGLLGLAAGVGLVALFVPQLRKRLLALAVALGGLGMLLGFLGLGRRRRAEQRREVGDARRDAVQGRREQKRADKAERVEVGKVEDSMEKAADQAELGSDGDLGELLELGARRRRERGSGKPPIGGGAA